MPVDPAGTTPGLPQGVADMPKIFMRCKQERKDDDGRVLWSCDSIEAYEVRMPSNAGFRMYRCVKCNHAHNVQMGGSFHIG